MPTEPCLFFYECENCKKVLIPNEGDCCVYYSFGSVKCLQYSRKKAVVKKPALEAIHICNSLKPTLLQKLQKSLSLPTLKTNQNGIKPVGNTVYKTQLLQAFREVFAYLLSPPNFYFCIFRKLKINRKNKNSARA